MDMQLIVWMYEIFIAHKLSKFMKLETICLERNIQFNYIWYDTHAAGLSPFSGLSPKSCAGNLAVWNQIIQHTIDLRLLLILKGEILWDTRLNRILLFCQFFTPMAFVRYCSCWGEAFMRVMSGNGALLKHDFVYSGINPHIMNW